MLIYFRNSGSLQQDCELCIALSAECLDIFCRQRRPYFSTFNQSTKKLPHSLKLWKHFKCVWPQCIALHCNGLPDDESIWEQYQVALRIRMLYVEFHSCQPPAGSLLVMRSCRLRLLTIFCLILKVERVLSLPYLGPK